LSNLNCYLLLSSLLFLYIIPLSCVSPKTIIKLYSFFHLVSPVIIIFSSIKIFHFSHRLFIRESYSLRSDPRHSSLCIFGRGLNGVVNVTNDSFDVRSSAMAKFCQVSAPRLGGFVEDKEI